MMKIHKQHTYEKVILGLELIGFGAVIALIWLDEYVDLPHRFFGALKTPLRPQEFWLEALSVLFVAIAIVSAKSRPPRISTLRVSSLPVVTGRTVKPPRPLTNTDFLPLML